MMEQSLVWSVIGAAGTVAAIWYGARRDQHQARTEFQQAIESTINPQLVELRRDVHDLRTRFGKMEADISFLRGRQHERDTSAQGGMSGSGT